jgi:hypothetical protein
MALRKLLETNFEMVSGDTKDIVVSVLDENDAVVPITGATAVFALSKTDFSPILFTKTVGSGIVITDGPGGILTVTLVEADTESLIGQHYYEIELTDAAFKVSTIALGRITIRKNQIQ